MGEQAWDTSLGHESRHLGRVSEEESGATPVGLAQKFGYSWDFCILWFFLINYLVALHCDPPWIAGKIQDSVGSSLGK